MKTVMENLSATASITNPKSSPVGVVIHQRSLYAVFEQELMPLPPAGEESENSSQPRPEPELQLSHVECLMYSFHQLAKRNPQFLASEESAERLRDFKLRDLA
ncbi:hypothetical protein HPB51_014301 [Rhipicephalus microplus]|uniref:Uncharacterized protein n=1 Tax=Rhipicephalus microplus TaxID=6941 RepID=A0A9J6DW91_RHIMP|nr:hypothetical protein HPB51_014301 [Rhipicephalus microplus]